MRLRILPIFAAIFSISFSATAPAGLQIDTVAGGKIQSGVPAQSVFILPTSVAVDDAGNVVFCETTRNLVRRVRTDGVLETFAGTGVSGFAGDGGPATQALLHSPSVARFDAKGNLYIADSANYRIRRVDTSGVITTVFGNGEQNLLPPTGPDEPATLGPVVDLALDDSGNVYFLEKNALNSRIRRLSSTGEITVVAGGGATPAADGIRATDAKLPGPVAIAVDGTTGTVFVSDSFDGLLTVTSDGIVHRPAAYASIMQPSWLAADAQGLLYAVVPSSGFLFQVDRIAADGTQTPMGSVPGGVSAFNRLLGIAVGKNGTVYFSDGSTVGKIPANGSAQTLAGGAPIPAADGTPSLDAFFVDPVAIAIGPNDDLYVAERETCTIRRIGADHLLETVAGTGACAANSSTAPNGPARSTALQPIMAFAVDRQGRLFVTQAYSRLVVSIGLDSMISTVPNSQFSNSFPALALDSHGQLYILDQDFVIRPTASGRLIAAPTRNPSSAVALAFDAADNLYVFFAGFWYILDPATLSTTGVLLSPLYGALVWGAVFDRAGALWVTDSKNLYRVADSATDARLVGVPGGFSGDGGPAVAALYNQPTSLAVSSTGDIYFLDAANVRIRKIAGTVPPAPVIASGGIVNSASLVAGPIAPGELITIFGTGFGSESLRTAQVENNSVSTVLGNLHVYIHSKPGVITAATATQINVFVPYSQPSGLANVDVVVDVDTSRSQTVSVPLAPTMPGLYAVDGSGSGQGAILNQDGSVNGSSNPAAPGSVITLFGTGEGVTTPQLPDGALVLTTPFPLPAAGVSVTVGGEPAEVLYAGEAPTLITGVLQVNVKVPADVKAGNAPIVLSVGGVNTTKQITCAIR